MKKWLPYLVFALISINISGQNCSILSKANNITPNKLCAPVTATWEITYTGVNDAGTPVSIRIDWDNGTVVTIPATKIGAGIFRATAVNVYTSAGNICNYHPKATLMVNGVLCTSSSQEQIVTVWDVDDHNGGYMYINPKTYPVCFGNSAYVRFQDATLFNCVPPQEEDNPNVNTRWIQWIYGTDNTMGGVPVTIGGKNRVFPFYENVIELPGPVTGSGVWSDVIYVAADKAVGEYFEVTLRNWNYCNPYDDPNIPGKPADKQNGDHPPVVTRARILIVPYPDATITPVAPMCANADPVSLTAATPGGMWSGNGVAGNFFDPELAGPGNHVIKYDITSSYGCHDQDEITIVVHPVPDATIISEGIYCNSDPPFALVSEEPGGIWSGTGVTGNIFDPAAAGAGNHIITYTILDANGCTDTDETMITVATPDATITPVDTLCVDNPVITLTAVDQGGIWTGPGISGNTFNPVLAGIGTHWIKYEIINPACSDRDSIQITVMPVPVVTIQPVGTVFLNGPSITLEATPPGGIWSGPGITGNVFNPNSVGLGDYVVQYETIPDRWGCMSIDTIHISVILPPPPVADFRPDTVGCAPLTVQFNNSSIYGEAFLWDFGDKQFSNEENPVHTYYLPGNYIVKLTVFNISGQDIHNGTILVYQNPVAMFDAYPTNVVNNEQIVVFYNYSYYDSLYFWRFGDGNTSTEENPYHKYENPGSYTVSLRVTTNKGCVDSTVLSTPINVEWKTGNIKFPNVFKWNGTGPTGGQWHEGVYPEMDYVFRPFFENVLEYKLQIFNRWGVLIYESNDVYKGWDGYHGDGNLAVQGVYVWKVTGRYADGKYFDIVGDVTFLH
jgi:PKD repeat protein